MYSVKRSSKFSETSRMETKKTRRTFNQENISISCIENLSNELFYEIFEYLDGCDIYKAFSNLNFRIQHLIIYSTLPLKIKYRSKAKSELENSCKNVIIPNRHNILSLNFENEVLINDFFTHCMIDSSFNRLESVVLGDVSYSQLVILLFYLKSLPRLFSLTVDLDSEWGVDLSTIYRLIFSFPSLKYNKLWLCLDDIDTELGILVPMATNERLSTIEYLIINHNCTFNELFSMLRHTPQLRHLTCGTLVDSAISIDIKRSVTLPNLTYLHCSDNGQVAFAKFEIFLTKISSQLQVLNIKTYWGEDYLEADRWERLIKKYIPQLRRFNCEHHDYFDPAYADVRFCTRINQFTLPFWAKRQWFFQVDISDDEIYYSIHPYRKTWVDLCTYDETIASFNQSSNHNPTKHIDKSSTQFITPIQFNITWLCSTEQHQSFIDKFKPIFVSVQFTRLNINFKVIPIGTLVRLIQLLPNLDSLKVSSLSPIEPGWLIGHDGKILFLTSVNNKITKFNLELITDIEQMNFIFYICRHIKYFQVNIPENIDFEILIRFIFKKATTYISHLTFLCIYISNINEEMVSKLNKLISADDLLPNYTIKFVCNKIILKCNCS